MQTIDDSLIQLVRTRRITRQVAMKYTKEVDRVLSK